jgi:hypothetical protein
MPGREISLSCYMRFLDWFLPIWFNDIHHNTTENYTFVDGFGAPINDVSIPAPAVSRRAIIAPHLNATVPFPQRISAGIPVQNGGKPFARSWQTTGSALEPPQTAEPRAGRAQDHINSSIQMNKSHQQRLIEARLWKVLALQSSLPRPGMCRERALGRFGT